MHQRPAGLVSGSLLTSRPAKPGRFVEPLCACLQCTSSATNSTRGAHGSRPSQLGRAAVEPEPRRLRACSRTTVKGGEKDSERTAKGSVFVVGHSPPLQPRNNLPTQPSDWPKTLGETSSKYGGAFSGVLRHLTGGLVLRVFRVMRVRPDKACLRRHNGRVGSGHPRRLADARTADTRKIRWQIRWQIHGRCAADALADTRWRALVAHRGHRNSARAPSRAAGSEKRRGDQVQHGGGQSIFAT